MGIKRHEPEEIVTRLKYWSAREWPGLMRFDRSVLPNRRINVGVSTMRV
jgi:hypothetical protein